MACHLFWTHGHIVLNFNKVREWWILNNCVRLVESMCHDVVMARKFSLWNILPTTCNDERNLIYSKRHTHICLYEYLLYMCTLYIFITHIYIFILFFNRCIEVLWRYSKMNTVKLYNLINFDICVYLWNYHHSEKNKHNITLKSFPWLLNSSQVLFKVVV